VELTGSSLLERSRALRPSLVVALARSLLPLVVGVGLALLLQLVLRPALERAGGEFYSKILLDILTNIILAVSLTMVNGFTGQFSMGHAAFMAVGAYSAACIVYYGSFRLYGDADVHGGLLSTMIGGRDVPWLTGADGLFLLSLLAGGLVASACGYIVGLPSLRLRGDYLAIVTLGFGEIVRVLIQQTNESLYDPAEIATTPVHKLPGYVGGALGFTGLPSYTSLFWTALFACVTLLVAFRLKLSSIGRAFLSIREDEIAAEAMGVNTTRYKVRAFVIAAFFAGIAGGLFAHTNGVLLKPDELGFMKSFDIIIMVVLGGLGSISGATLAAVILTILPELLRDPPSVWPWGLLIGAGVAGVAAVFARRPWRPLVVVALMLLVWEGARLAALRAGINLADYRMIVYALLLIGMMILRPQGLLGIREIWDIRVGGGKDAGEPGPGDPLGPAPVASALNPVAGRHGGPIR
jgi:branched-chain amino acid transport system permease protein